MTQCTCDEIFNIGPVAVRTIDFAPRLPVPRPVYLRARWCSPRATIATPSVPYLDVVHKHWLG